MVDMTALSKLHGSEASRRRLAQRRNAEKRLKLYGIAAIAFAGFALITLMWSVVYNARTVLTEAYISLPLTVSAEGVDPDNTADPDVLFRARWANVVRDRFREEFPYVTGRSERRELGDLYSGGTVFELRDHIIANPGLIGQEITYDFLASDTVDLYLKGEFGQLQEIEHEGDLTLTYGEQSVEIVADQPIFAGLFDLVQADLVTLAEVRLEEAGRQDAGVVEFQRRADAATADEARSEALAEVESRSARRDALRDEAEDLMRRSRDQGGFEPVSPTNPSIYINVNGGWLHVTAVGANRAEADIIVPMATQPTVPQSYRLLLNEVPERARPISDNVIIWIEELRANDRIEQVFNWRFFTAADSRDPELAGIWGAAVGSFWTMLVTFCVAFPIGVLAAIYLEEFAPKNAFTDFIEVNINNLAAVPSIVFGLLGLSVFLGFFGLPRSAPLAGGLVLALMTLPTIIIAARASVRAVPPSIRDAALGLGASKLQTAFHHVLPLAMPGILTGTIIGMAQALGETAPLILIGMVAFIVDVPHGIYDSATVLPVQVFRWSDFPERAFEARTAAAIVVLLAFLVIMNTLAVFLRKRFERRW